MFKLFSTLKWLIIFHPRDFVRQRLKLPLIKFIHDTVDLYKSLIIAGVINAREILFRGTLFSLITSLLVWLSICMYVVFYNAYVPDISHERQIYLNFIPCEKTSNSNGLCSFPSAYIQLTKRQQFFMIGQPYKIELELEMPESPNNKELGMFMVCADFHGIDGSIIANSCRSTMLHYRSFLVDILYKLFFSPLYIFGTAEEKQNIIVELFSVFLDCEFQPVTQIFIEIQTKNIEIYSAKFLVNAHFTGLRFLMYNWPIFSAAIGITSNLFFIAIICMISWYQIINSEEYLNYLQNVDNKHFKNYDNETPPSSSTQSSRSSISNDDSIFIPNKEESTRKRSLYKQDIEDINSLNVIN